MAIVYTGETRQDSGTQMFEVLCESCKKAIGWLSSTECSFLTAYGDPVFCFDCDQIMANEVPLVLQPTQFSSVVLRDPETRRLSVIGIANERGETSWHACLA